MHRPLAYILITLLGMSLLLGACRRDAQLVQPEQPLQPFPTGSIARTSLLDDFESAITDWSAGTWPSFSDSSALRVEQSTVHATHGTYSLRLSFDLSDKPKAIFLFQRDIQLNTSEALAFDVYNEDSAAGSLAIALRTGDQWTWQESKPLPLKPGPNALQFDLTTKQYKTATAAWHYSTTLSHLNAVHQLAIIVYPVRAGSVYVDQLLAMREAQVSPSPLQAHSQSPYVALRTPHTSLARMDLLELDVDTNVASQNPFDPNQIAIDVHFDSPTGQRYNIPAFFYQDFNPVTYQPLWPQKWKARFTPVSEGTWTAIATLHTPSLTLQSAVLSFEVTPSVSQGFIRVSRENNRYLAYDNGESYFPVGLNLAWGHANPLEDYRRWLNALQANGASVTRIWMASWAFGIEWSDSGLGHYRLDRAWQLDQVMQMAARRGISIILVLINHGAFNITVNPEWNMNPYNAALGGPCQQPVDFATNAQAQKLFMQRLRYIAARWGYATNLLAWEWWNEVDLTPIGDLNVLRPWLAQMTAYMHSVDPYHHLSTISFASTTDPRIMNLPGIDLWQRHEYTALDPMISMPKAYATLTGYGTQPSTHPILFGEFGASANGEQPTRFDPEGIQFHNALWASTFSGFANAALYWWWDTYIDPNHYWYHLQGLSRFLSDQDVARLHVTSTQVNTTTVQAMSLARDDQALVWLRDANYSVEQAVFAYQQATLFGGMKDSDWHLTFQKRQGASVTLSEMAPGHYRVQWFDTRNGQLVLSATAQVMTSTLTITAPPFQRDIAAKMIRTSS